MTEPRKRPRAVSFAVALMFIGGIAQIVLGILSIFLRYTPDASEAGLALFVTLFGAAMVIFGLFVVSLASAVARGSRVSRVMTVLVLLLGLGLAVADFVAARDGDWSGVAVMSVAAALVIVPLFTGPARRYFVR